MDKAIIGAERLVDRETGVITYSKKGGDGKPIFQCHPVEKPFRESDFSSIVSPFYFTRYYVMCRTTS